MEKMYPMMIQSNIMSDLSDFSVPWKNDINAGLINQTFLDLGYYGHSAEKLVSPIVFAISDSVIDDYSITIVPLTAQQRTNIAGTVYTIFNRKWSKLWEIQSVEYNPISNYDMRETEIETGTNASTGTNTGTITTDTDTDTRNSRSEGGTKTIVTDNDTSQTGTIADSGSTTVENGVYGFNSSNSVGSEDGNSTVANTRTNNLHGTEDITETETRNLTDTTTNIVDGTELETRNLSESKNESRNVSRTLTRSGNIGVTTSQQMIQSEIELWKWNFFKSVFEDIDSICCLDVY